MPGLVYLDYAATTPVDPRVADVMMRYLTAEGDFGNPSSTTHAIGLRARNAVDKARAHVAALVGAHPSEIVWTSGATESINLAIKGVATVARGRHLVTFATEHRAVLDVHRALEATGFDVTYVTPGRDGLLDIEMLERVLRTDTALVTVSHVNNEIGVIQDLRAIGALTRRHGVLLHIDAAQSAGKVPIDVDAYCADLVSLSAHKFYGPKGVGALYVRHRPAVQLAALIHGGDQERGLRAGTLATHQIVGMGAAYRMADEHLDKDSRHIRALRDRLWRGLRARPGVRLNGSPEHSIAGILNVGFDDVRGEALLDELDGFALATGSACTAAEAAPSHVLRALGLSDEQADGSIRFSFGRFTTAAEIDAVLTAVSAAVATLREDPP